MKHLRESWHGNEVMRIQITSATYCVTKLSIGLQYQLSLQTNTMHGIRCLADDSNINQYWQLVWSSLAISIKFHHQPSSVVMTHHPRQGRYAMWLTHVSNEYGPCFNAAWDNGERLCFYFVRKHQRLWEWIGLDFIPASKTNSDDDDAAKAYGAPQQSSNAAQSQPGALEPIKTPA